MTSADMVRKVCEEKKIPLGRIEKALGFSNAYLKRLKNDLPMSRLKEIADYIGVPMELLLPDGSVAKDILFGNGSDATAGNPMSTDTDKKDDILPYGIKSKEYIESLVDNRMKERYYFDPEAAQIAQELKDNPGIKVLFDACRKVKPEDMAKVAKMIGAFTEE